MGKLMHWFLVAFCIAVVSLITERCYSRIDKFMFNTNKAAAH